MSKPLALVIVALVAEMFVVAAAASAQGADVTPTSFVSNHGQMATDDGFLTHGGTVFQGFTTGGNPDGYELSDVGVVLQLRPPDPEQVLEMSGPISGVVLNQANSEPGEELEPPTREYRIEIWSETGVNIKMPGQWLYTLTTPVSVPLDEQVAFTAPSDTILAPNTSYYVRIIGAEQVAGDWDRQVDNDTAEGWSLAEGLMYQSPGANAWVRFIPNAVVTIRGTAL